MKIKFKTINKIVKNFRMAFYILKILSGLLVKINLQEETHKVGDIIFVKKK